MEAAALRVCPGCQSRMSRVFAKAVELDLCQFCGGVWFDRGEVLAVTGQSEWLGARGPRHLLCPDCAEPMVRGAIRDCSVEQCLRCSGTYVPPQTVDLLAGEEIRFLPIPEERPGGALEFRCGGCGDKLPLERAVTTARGLACINCAGTMDSVSSVLPGAAEAIGEAGGGVRFQEEADVDWRVEADLPASPWLKALLRFVERFVLE